MYRFILLLGLCGFAAQAAEPIKVSSPDKQTAVVELYTSEGCSSCPPADKWLSRLTRVPRDDANVLALAFHVDYWDYLGWRDRFSSADYTARQRLLGANNAQRTIYTPEFFVNGKEARGTGKVLDMIEAVNRSTSPVDFELKVSRDVNQLLLEVQLPDNPDLRAHHQYLVYENNLATEVERGENRGSRLEHQVVVRYLSKPLRLKSINQHRVPIDPQWNPNHVGVAVLVTSAGSREYLQAVHTPVAELLLD